MVTKFAVSVTEMAKMAGLSRARFYQLVKKGAFPVADKDQISGRSCYLAEKQQQILESRRKNCGIDGNPILFYSRRSDSGKPEIKSVSPKLQSKAITNILESLEAFVPCLLLMRKRVMWRWLRRDLLYQLSRFSPLLSRVVRQLLLF